MILETTNPKYQQRPQIPAFRKVYLTSGREAESDFVSAGSRAMARGELQTENFVDRLPHEAPKPILNREPPSRPRGSSLCLFDEAHDAPLWLIVDALTGHIFARVRGSLAWVVSQLRLAADQLGGKEQDLYFRRADV